MSDRDPDGRLAELRRQARYAGERLQLYRARLYAGRTHNPARLRDLQRASDDAAARLRRAEGRGEPPAPAD